MAKFRVNCSGAKTQVNIKITAPECFLVEQCRFLYGNYIPGLVRLDGINGNNASFSAPANAKLRDMLNRGIDKNTFFCIIVQLINTLYRLNTDKLGMSNLIMNTEYAFVNTSTKEMYMLYVPAGCEKPRNGINMFLQSLIYESSFLYGEDGAYRQELAKLLNVYDPVDVKKLERFVTVFCPEMSNSIIKGCGEAKERISDTKSEFLRQTEKSRQYQPMNNSEGRAGTDIYYANSGHLGKGYEHGTVVLENEFGAGSGTTVLPKSDCKTTLLEEGTMVLDDGIGAAPVVLPVIIRKRTGEEAQINKPVFRIGKEEGTVDFLICDNSTISRSHADIISRDGKYFIYDNNSTNRTYVNNVLIEPLKNVEIFDGTNIRLSNEEFEFRIMNY